MTDYQMFRGKCKELSEQAALNDSTLKLVRGHYYCPMWNKDEAHWWTKRQDGTIYDPSKDQFPSKGMGIYKEFNGIVECAECGKDIEEKDINQEYAQGRYVCCSYNCFGKLVGVF